MAETTDNHRLIVSLEARIRSYEKSLERAQAQTNTRMKGIESALKRPQAAFEQTGATANRVLRKMETDARRSSTAIASSFKGMATGLAAGVSLQAAQKLVDSATRIDNALKVAGLSGDALTKVYDKLFASAQRNGAPLEGLVTLYSRVALAQKDLGVSSEQIVGLVDTVGKAIALSGGNAEQAAGALLQLGQSLGGGVVQAEEYNSLIDGLPGLLQAAAAGIKEAGGSVSTLTRLVKDGEVSSKAFFDGIAAGSAVLEDKLAGAEQTVSQAFVRLQNVLIDAAGKFNDSTDASHILANFMDGPLTQAIQELGSVFSGLGEGPVADFIGWINAATEAALQGAADIGAALGSDQVGALFGAKPYVGQKRIQDRIDGAFGPAARKGDRKPTEITATDPNSVVKPVSLADYPVTGGSGGKGKGGRKSTRERADEYERLTKRIADSTAATIAETEAQRGLNPLVNDYGYAAEKARTERELLTAAEEAGKKVTPELRAEVSALAEQYATAGVESAKLAQNQDELRESFEGMRELGKDVLGGFISDLADGKSAAEALSGALKKVGDKLLEITMNDLFGKSGSGGLGIIGQLFGLGGGSMFTANTATGLYHTGGTVGAGGASRKVSSAAFASAPRFHNGTNGVKSNEMAAVLLKGEEVLRQQQAMRHTAAMGSLASLASQGGGRGAMDISVGVNDDGKLIATINRVAGSAAEARVKVYDEAILPSRVQHINSDPWAR